MIQTKETDKGIMHYSDLNLRILQVETGIIYDTADDILPCPYTYVETEEPIPEDIISWAKQKIEEEEINE